MNNVIIFPNSLQSLTFEELISKSNKIISDGIVDEHTVNLFIKEYNRRLDCELKKIRNQISELENE